jgi:hypothetical protein
MVRGVTVKRVQKKVRQRRAMSPDQYQIALQSILTSLRGKSAYHWRKTYSRFGYPSVRVVILLGCGFDNAAAARAAVDYLNHELDDMVEHLSIVVTYCDATFWQFVHVLSHVE